MYTIQDTNKFLIKLGKNFTKLREVKNLTKERCAIECDISRSYLYQIELGKANPTLKELLKISNGLDCEITDLLPI